MYPPRINYVRQRSGALRRRSGLRLIQCHQFVEHLNTLRKKGKKMPGVFHETLAGQRTKDEVVGLKVGHLGVDGHPNVRVWLSLGSNGYDDSSDVFIQLISVHKLRPAQRLVPSPCAE